MYILMVYTFLCPNPQINPKILSIKNECVWMAEQCSVCHSVAISHCTLSSWVIEVIRMRSAFIINCLTLVSQMLQLFSWPASGATNAMVKLALNSATLIVRSSRHGKGYCVRAQSKEIVYEKLLTGLLNHFSKGLLWTLSDLNWICGV